MVNTWAIFKRELRAYFSSPVAYVVITMFLLISGFFFYFFFLEFNQVSLRMIQQRFGQIPTVNDYVMGRLFFNITVIFMFVLPMLTMRQFAEEKRSGTMELLLTYPVRDGEVILGKYLASMFVLVVMLAATALYPGFLLATTTPEIPPILTGYLGILLVGSCFVAVGMFVSSMSENQVVAGFTTFGILLVFWVIGAVKYFSEATVMGVSVGDIFEHLAITTHLESFVKGLIETKDIVYYICFTVLGLFLTYSSLQSKRWRG
jgi:ABC-2 type transport system permease protein